MDVVSLISQNKINGISLKYVLETLYKIFGEERENNRENKNKKQNKAQESTFHLLIYFFLAFVSDNSVF